MDRDSMFEPEKEKRELVNNLYDLEHENDTLKEENQELKYQVMELEQVIEDIKDDVFFIAAQISQLQTLVHRFLNKESK